MRASRIPFHASRSIRSSCRPRFPLSVGPVGLEGRPTPRGGGTKLGGGALIAEGAIRDCRICARDERIAIWID